jgi:hypothetical protein
MKVEMTVELSTRQISEAGKLLVQYRLQLEGVESERNAPGSKPHLVAAGSSTIEVYSNREPKPAGGKGRLALAWMLDGASAADLIAVTDLSTHRVWLFRRQEAFALAQQHPASGGHHLVMVTDPGLTRSKHERILDTDFSEFLLERRAGELLRTQAA